jgi:hypothetical protein
MDAGLRRVDSTSAFFTDAIPASAIHLNARSINLGLEKFLAQATSASPKTERPTPARRK